MQKLSNLGDVISPSIDAYRAGQQRADQVRKQSALAELGAMIQSGTPLRQAAAQGLANGVPLSAFTSVSQLGNQDRAYGRQVERDAVGDRRFEQQFDFRKQRAAAGDARADRAFTANQENMRVDNARADKQFALQQSNSEFNRRARSIELSLKKRAANSKPGIDISGEQKLRKEFQGLTKDFRDVRDAYTRIESSAEDPSAAGDLALIFNYMKVLDPGSVVRESEFATAQNSAGVPDRIRNIYNKVLSGQRLGVEQRKDFVGRGRQLYEGRLAQYKKTSNQFTSLAQRSRLNPENVVLDLERPVQTPQQEAAPAISDGATATNPQTGDKIIFQGGQWISSTMTQLPPGFVLDSPVSAQNGLPSGFVLDAPQQTAKISSLAGKSDKEVGALDTISDVAQSAGTGLRAGVEALVGLPGDVEDGVASAYEFVRSLVADETPEENARRLAIANSVAAPGLPSTSDIRSVTNQIFGEPRAPETTAGQYAKTIAEFAPSIAAGPGSVAKKGVTAVAAGGLSEAAGQATEGTAAEPLARAAGAIVGGGLSTLQLNRAAKKVLKEAPDAETVKKTTDALYNQLRASGIQYNPSQYELAIGSLAGKLQKKRL